MLCSFDGDDVLMETMSKYMSGPAKWRSARETRHHAASDADDWSWRTNSYRISRGRQRSVEADMVAVRGRVERKRA